MPTGGTLISKRAWIAAAVIALGCVHRPPQLDPAATKPALRFRLGPEEAVPPDMLDGTRLVEREQGFSLVAPPGWTWVRARVEEEGGWAYLCKESQAEGVIYVSTMSEIPYVSDTRPADPKSDDDQRGSCWSQQFAPEGPHLFDLVCPAQTLEGRATFYASALRPSGSKRVVEINGELRDYFPGWRYDDFVAHHPAFAALVASYREIE